MLPLPRVSPGRQVPHKLRESAGKDSRNLISRFAITIEKGLPNIFFGDREDRNRVSKGLMPDRTNEKAHVHIGFRFIPPFLLYHDDLGSKQF